MGLVQIIRGAKEEAQGLAGGLREARVEAETLSRIRAPRSIAAPATFAPPSGSPRSPSGPPPSGGVILSRDGRPATTSSGGSGGGGSSSPSPGGGGAGGRSFAAAEVLRSLDGTKTATRAWLAESGLCVLTEIDVPARGFTGAISRKVRAWVCGEFGTYIDEPSALASRSGSSAGGGASRGTDPRFGIEGPVGLQEQAFGRRPNRGSRAGDPASGSVATEGRGLSSGPQQVTGDVRAPGVENELRRTNSLLERSLQSDGGAALRAAGGL